MIWFLLLLFVPALAQDTLTVEMAARKDDGEVLEFFSPDRRNAVWAELIIRGTHDDFYGRIEFVPALYKKYYQRVVQLSNGKIDTVAPLGSFRTHMKQPGIAKAWDVVKPNVRITIQQAWKDIRDAGLVVPQANETDWGKKAKIEFELFNTTELTRSDLDSISSDRADGKKYYVDLDSLKTKNKPGILRSKRMIKKSWLRKVQ